MRGHLYAVSNYLKENRINIGTKKENLPTFYGILEQEKRARPPGDGAEAIELQDILKFKEQIKKDPNLTEKIN